MRIIMLQGTFAFGILSIALLALAAINKNNDLALALAIMAAMVSYLSQWIASLSKDDEPSSFVLIINWFFWIIACSLTAMSFFVLFETF